MIDPPPVPDDSATVGPWFGNISVVSARVAMGRVIPSRIVEVYRVRIGVFATARAPEVSVVATLAA
ncbi:hypothetical protein MSA03_26910 [Microbacterium saccharophilum]|nr:hypothetical protein MSA03_26910 [Microbacterium saccharophilum]